MADASESLQSHSSRCGGWVLHLPNGGEIWPIANWTMAKWATKIAVEIIEMTDEELQNMAEFEGW